MVDQDTGEGLDATQAGDEPNAVETPSVTAEKTYTQKDVERILAERLARETRKQAALREKSIQDALEHFRESHGITDEALETLTKKDKTQLELKKRIREHEALLESHNKMRARLERETIDGAIIRAATGKAISPDLVVKLLRDHVALDEEFSPYAHEGGDPTGLTIDQLVDQLLTKHKEFALPKNIAPGAGSRVAPVNATEPKFDLMTREGRLAALQYFNQASNK